MISKVMEIDIARFGNGQSVILVRQDQKILEVQKYRNIDLVQMVEHAKELIKKWWPKVILVDPSGVGAGVVDLLRHSGFDVTERLRGGNHG